MTQISKLTSLPRGSSILFGGDRLARVPDAIADRFEPGDAVVVVEASAEVLLIPARERALASDAVSRAHTAFGALRALEPAAISRFFECFALELESDAVWSAIEQVNRSDVEAAQARGRSTTRLVTSDTMRRDMIEGLRGWIEAPSRSGQVLERVQRDGLSVELIGAPLGVVAFVFEGRPNVLADATGVLRGGNTVVFRIGSDALGTARTIMEVALRPALRGAGLPEDAVCLLESAEHAAGWALFGDRRLGLAVARGSGPAVATLGALAQQAGIPVSLHGTGGAWIVASGNVTADALERAVFDSLDRKVCNTLNTLCIPRARAAELVPAALRGL
jgi:glutamate-5-semialdehyde dehydrogenase